MSLLSSFLTQSGVATTVFTANGTFTATQSKMYLFMLQGGGGGGGACSNNNTQNTQASAAGGGGGRCSVLPIYMTSGQTATIAIGAAGTGGTCVTTSATNTPPTTGGATTATIGSIVYSAAGGGASSNQIQVTSVSGLILGGVGGGNTSTTAGAASMFFGDSESGANGLGYYISAQVGGTSSAFPDNPTSGFCQGGSSRFGKGGITITQTTFGSTAPAGTGYGAGGAGAINTAGNSISFYGYGGNGSPGICYVIG
jgi:hypothetical protein